MLKISHIVSPADVPPTSDLYRAQPVTFEAMKKAKDFAAGALEVRQFAAVFPDERINLPGNLEGIPPLERSIRNFQGCGECRKLPIIKDILDRLYHRIDAHYMIYSNVDIAPMPYFYTALAEIIKQGYDGFIINRRTISDHYGGPEHIHSMFAEVGETHPGSDCFVFKRELYPKFILGNVAVGARFFGLTLRTNVAAFSKQFKHFKDLHLTFHIGDDRVWKTYNEDSRFNLGELERIYAELLDNADVADRERLNELHCHFIQRRNYFLEHVDES
jgi:hypothetical protein